MATKSAARVPVDAIRSSMLLRDRQVMLDEELAQLYGVETKRLVEQVKRNSARFPEDFMFQLTREEAAAAAAAPPPPRSPSKAWQCCRASCAAKPKRKVGFAPPQDRRDN